MKTMNANTPAYLAGSCVLARWTRQSLSLWTVCNLDRSLRDERLFYTACMDDFGNLVEVAQ